jgi:hypothetical protein
LGSSLKDITTAIDTSSPISLHISEVKLLYCRHITLDPLLLNTP